MSEDLYLVTCDGHAGGYGSEIYLVGIFTTEEQAEAAINQVNLDINTALRNKYDDWHDQNYCRITLVDKDIEYPVRSYSDTWWDEFSNDKYLGGYYE